MQQTTDHPTTAPESGLTAAALRAEAWAGEAFLHNGEDPEQVLAPGTARRRALDDALAEIEAGAREPSNGWKVRYGLMLGLERILSDRPPRLASGTELRRHQIDALAGMLTELIAANQQEAEPANGNGNGAAADEAEDTDGRGSLLSSPGTLTATSPDGHFLCYTSGTLPPPRCHPAGRRPVGI